MCVCVCFLWFPRMNCLDSAPVLTVFPLWFPHAAVYDSPVLYLYSIYFPYIVFSLLSVVRLHVFPICSYTISLNNVPEQFPFMICLCDISVLLSYVIFLYYLPMKFLYSFPSCLISVCFLHNMISLYTYSTIFMFTPIRIPSIISSCEFLEWHFNMSPHEVSRDDFPVHLICMFFLFIFSTGLSHMSSL